MGMVNSGYAVIRMDMRIAARYIITGSPVHSMGMPEIKSSFIIKIMNVRSFHHLYSTPLLGNYIQY